MRHAIRRFLSDQSATITVEVVLVMPILLWGYFGMFMLFEGYRALSSNVRVSYTISDLISRETQAVNAAYIEGLNDIQDILTQSFERTALRVSVVSFDSITGQHSLEWSYATTGQDAITDADLNTALVPHLPTMVNGEQLVAVETWVAFNPFLNITVLPFYAGADPERAANPQKQNVFPALQFESIAVTRPRFAGQLCWESCT